MTVIVRDYQPGDEEALNRLHNQTFGDTRSLDVWRWKYTEGPCAPLTHIAVMQDDERIVGHYGGVLAEVKYQGRTLLITQPTDIAIEEDYRGRWLLGKLLAYYVTRAPAKGLAFGFGFPNPAHYAPGKRLGYKDVGSVWLICCHVNPGLLLAKLTRQSAFLRLLRGPANWMAQRLRRTASLPEGLTITPVTRFDERFDALWQQTADRYPIAVARTSRYLNWRYGARPGADYTVLAAERAGALMGYTVLALQRRTVVQGQVADLWALDEATSQALLARAVEHFLRIGVDRVSAWALEDSQAAHTLARAGLRPHRVAAPLVCKVLTEGLVEEATLCDPRHWYVTMGDGDGV